MGSICGAHDEEYDDAHDDDHDDQESCESVIVVFDYCLLSESVKKPLKEGQREYC